MLTQRSPPPRGTKADSVLAFAMHFTNFWARCFSTVWASEPMLTYTLSIFACAMAAAISRTQLQATLISTKACMTEASAVEALAMARASTDALLVFTSSAFPPVFTLANAVPLAFPSAAACYTESINRTW